MSGLFSSPKMPKDTTVADLEKKKKMAEAEARNKFLTDQKTRSKYGRQSTVLAQDEEQTTTLGG